MTAARSSRVLRLAGVAALALAVLPSAACSPAGALCAKEQECDDQRAPDDERVCQTAYDAQLKALHENGEADCQDLANKQEDFDACRAQLDCADFQEADLNGLCADEKERYAKALENAKGECASTD
jgi:hypothetical protein